MNSEKVIDEKGIEFANKDAMRQAIRSLSVQPDLLLVGLGAPRQELWMAEHRDEVGQALMLGVGGSMDVFAGDVQRAPEAWRRAGLEWTYRLLKQPSRIGRMMKLPLFLLSVVWERIVHGKGNA